MIEFRRLEQNQLASITSTINAQTMQVAKKIVDAVTREGEVALRRFGTEYDGNDPDASLLIRKSQLDDAKNRIDPKTRGLLERVADRIRNFATAQRQTFSNCQVEIPGGVAGHRWLPLGVAGCYAPAGRYPLPSSVLMTAITARVAGVKQVWVASPKSDDVMLAAAAIADADGLLLAGGAQAIAALASGIDDMPRCDVIVGPGNRYVTAAKAIISQTTRIDMLAGPSELVIVAGADANPDFIAADLLAQAEHDPDARPILIATESSLVEAVLRQLETQLADLPTADVARQALSSGGYLVVTSIDDAIECCAAIAPEHLSLQGQEIESLANRFEFGAAVFIGSKTAEVFGDYGAGPNHVLPTGGAARSQSGLSVATFMKMQTQLQMHDDFAAQSIVDDARELGIVEGLIAHSQSAAIRQTKIKSKLAR